ncbi:MAG: DUF3795 domain-containing protein, partial [Bacteroidales bacterium]|nr:DUF3795 domain-containing protein [Bacteroidales bacterium]
KAGFEVLTPMLPDGDKFWSFLKDMAENGVCISCKQGSGNPGCEIRKCAKEKNIEMCALCESYPCKYFAELLEACPILKDDNSVLREKGMIAWSKLQDERQAIGFTYTDYQDVNVDKTQ